MVSAQDGKLTSPIQCEVAELCVEHNGNPRALHVVSYASHSIIHGSNSAKGAAALASIFLFLVSSLVSPY